MIDSKIQIQLDDEETNDEDEAPTQYQEWIARFCFASAKLAPSTVEHVLGLMEACGDTSEPDEIQ